MFFIYIYEKNFNALICFKISGVDVVFSYTLWKVFGTSLFFFITTENWTNSKKIIFTVKQTTVFAA